MGRALCDETWRLNLSRECRISKYTHSRVPRHRAMSLSKRDPFVAGSAPPCFIAFLGWEKGYCHLWVTPSHIGPKSAAIDLGLDTGMGCSRARKLDKGKWGGNQGLETNRPECYDGSWKGWGIFVEMHA